MRVIETENEGRKGREGEREIDREGERKILGDWGEFIRDRGNTSVLCIYRCTCTCSLYVHVCVWL